MPKKSFDKSYKMQVVQRVQENKQSVAAMARELDIHVNTIYKWVGEFKRDGEDVFPGSGNLKPDDLEMRKLKRDLHKIIYTAVHFNDRRSLYLRQ